MKVFYVYKVTQESTGYYYIGSRGFDGKSCDDSYKGSPSTWKLTKSEKFSLKKEIIEDNIKSPELAIQIEAYHISKNIENPLNQNHTIPNRKFHANGKVTCKTDNGKIVFVSTKDPLYLTGKLKFIHFGMVTVRDGDSIISVDINDERYINGELKFMHCGMVTVKDSKGNHFKVSNTDEKFLSGELKSSSKGTVLVYDTNGNTMRVSINDPRYINGELTFIAKGKVSVKDTLGNQFYVDKTDPRFISGELVGTSKGYWSWCTKLMVNDLVERAKYFSTIYNVKIKDLKSYFELNSIKYDKIT